MSHSYWICQRVWKWQQCCARAQDQYVLDPVSNKWKKKKINREITISQPPPSIRFPGTSTRAINCHLAGVLLKLTNRSKTDWRSESINYNNFPLQPSGVWCCSTTGSECTPTQPMAPSGWAFNSSKCSWSTNSAATDAQWNVNHPLPNSSGYHRLQIRDNHAL